MALSLSTCAPAAVTPTPETPAVTTSNTSTTRKLLVQLTIQDPFKGRPALLADGSTAPYDERLPVETPATNPVVHEGVVVWVTNGAGAYVDTIAFYSGWNDAGYTHAGNPANSLTGPIATALARSWTADAGARAGVDGVSSATTFRWSDTFILPPLEWDCRDYRGSTVPDGTYVVKVLLLRNSPNTYGATLYDAVVPFGTVSANVGLVGIDSTDAGCAPADAVSYRDILVAGYATFTP
jgi:hypothetical protein